MSYVALLGPRITHKTTHETTYDSLTRLRMWCIKMLCVRLVCLASPSKRDFRHSILPYPDSVSFHVFVIVTNIFTSWPASDGMHTERFAMPLTSYPIFVCFLSLCQHKVNKAKESNKTRNNRYFCDDSQAFHWNATRKLLQAHAFDKKYYIYRAYKTVCAIMVCLFKYVYCLNRCSHGFSIWLDG